MQPTEANSPGKRVIFIAIGLVLLGLVVFGVVWAKNRADQYGSADTSQQTGTETESTATEETTVEQESEVAGATAETDGEETAPVENPESTIPAAGSKDTLLTAAMLSIVAFSVTKFLRSEVFARRV